MRKIRKRKGNRNKKIIIMTTFALICCLTIGYAAFGTTLNLKAKGNVVVLEDLYVASYGSDSTGNGTGSKPFATIQKAYDRAGDAASIHILDNITQKETINFDKNKEITLDSVNNNSVIRDNSLTNTLLNITSGTTTFENITFDGNNVEVGSAMIEVCSDIVIEDGAVFKNTYSTGDFGGAISFRSGTSIINGGDFFDNNVEAGGSALYIHNMNSNIIINNCSIHDNTSRDGAIWSAGIITINNVQIYNNVSSGGAGGIFNNGELTINNGEIHDNKAGYGGGIANGDVGYNTTITIKGGKIYNNTATGYGGGLYLNPNTVYTNTGGTIENNNPDNVYRAS